MASKGRRKRIAFSDAVRSRRALRTLWHNACISYRRYEKSMNKFRLSFFELMTASKGRRKRIAFSDVVRSRQALRTLWHNACISYHRYEKIRERISFTDLELMTRLELVTSSLPRMCSTTWATSAYFGGSGGIRTPVGFHPNGFQDRLVMTASIRFHNC